MTAEVLHSCHRREGPAASSAAPAGAAAMPPASAAASPPTGWRSGKPDDLERALAELGLAAATCAWVRDPRPARGPAGRMATCGAGTLPWHDGGSAVPIPLCEAHLFWRVPPYDVWELAVVAVRDGEMRWTWQRHAGAAGWTHVADAGGSPVAARIDNRGTLVLLPRQDGGRQ